MFDQLRARAAREVGVLEERLDESRHLVLGERREQDRRRVDLAAAPSRPTRKELGTSGAECEQRHAASPLDQVVDEVEQ